MSPRSQPRPETVAEEVLQRLQVLSVDAQVVNLRDLLQRAVEGAGVPSNKRDSPRSRVLRTGKAIYNNKSCVVDFQVLDISEAGCRIRVSSSASLPRIFTLSIQGADRAREC